MHLDTDGFSARLPRQAEAAIFYIVQEAVNNARKHAEAKNVWIVTREQNNFLTITVQDDGRGFDVGSVEGEYAKRGSLGLLNMRERGENREEGKLAICPTDHCTDRKSVV